jgi:hypothetical protein
MFHFFISSRLNVELNEKYQQLQKGEKYKQLQISTLESLAEMAEQKIQFTAEMKKLEV